MEVHFYCPSENMKSSVGFYAMMANPASSDNHAERQKMNEKDEEMQQEQFMF